MPGLKKSRLRHALLLSGAVMGATAAQVALAPTYAQAAMREFKIPSQSLADALRAFATQSGRDVLFAPGIVAGKVSPGVAGTLGEADALRALLAGTGLTFQVTSANGYAVLAQSAQAEPAKVPEVKSDGASSTTNETSSADGDTDSSSDGNVEKVTVTGSRIRGGDKFSPVQKVTRDDLDRAGMTSASDFVTKLPQNFGGGASVLNSPGSGSGPGAVGVNLRGLGNSATLVLVNGRRLAPSGFAGKTVDVSAIPISAIDRIEVLADGASAIYGTDAVAGVMNFILRKDFNGAETRARYGNISTGDASEYQIAQTLGVAGDDHYGLLSYQFTKSDALPLRAKEKGLSAGDRSQLFPASKQDALFASGGVSLSDRTRLSADILATTRDTEMLYTLFGTSRLDAPTVDQVAAAGTIEHDISADWQVSFTGSVGRTGFESTNTNLDAGVADLDRTVTQVIGLEAVIRGSLFDTDAGPVRSVVGGQFRRESFDGTSAQSTGAVTFDDENSREVSAAFTEFLIPIVDKPNAAPWVEELSVSLAYRYESYSNAGSVGNPKVGILYSPAPGLRLRASYGESLRAPDLFEQNDKLTITEVAYYVDPSSPSGYATVFLVNGNQSTLRPETSKSLSYGFDLKPSFVDNLLLRFTAYEIWYEGRIDIPGLDFVLDASLPFGFAYTNFTGPVTVNPSLGLLQSLNDRSPFFFNSTSESLSGATLLLDRRSLNTATTETSGIDLNITHRFAVGDGDISWHANANYIFRFDQREFSSGPVLSKLDRVFQPADLKFRAGAVWSLGEWQVAGDVNYVDDYKDLTNGSEVPSWTTLDLSVGYTFDDGSFLGGTRLMVTATNVLDNDPPRLTSPQGSSDPAGGRNLFFDSTNADPTGRKVALQLTTRW